LHPLDQCGPVGSGKAVQSKNKGHAKVKAVQRLCKGRAKQNIAKAVQRSCKGRAKQNIAKAVQKLRLCKGRAKAVQSKIIGCAKQNIAKSVQK